MPKVKVRQSRWKNRAEKGDVRNVIHIARHYQEYLERPEVLGYKETAQHFGVTKTTVSYYLGLLNRLPAEFVSWLEGCRNPQVLAFFSESRLRPLTRMEQAQQRSALCTEALRLASEVDDDVDEIEELKRLFQKATLLTPLPREQRIIQLD